MGGKERYPVPVQVARIRIIFLPSHLISSQSQPPKDNTHAESFLFLSRANINPDGRKSLSLRPLQRKTKNSSRPLPRTLTELENNEDQASLPNRYTILGPSIPVAIHSFRTWTCIRCLFFSIFITLHFFLCRGKQHTTTRNPHSPGRKEGLHSALHDKKPEERNRVRRQRELQLGSRDSTG